MLSICTLDNTIQEFKEDLEKNQKFFFFEEVRLVYECDDDDEDKCEYWITVKGEEYRKTNETVGENSNVNFIITDFYFEMGFDKVISNLEQIQDSVEGFKDYDEFIQSDFMKWVRIGAYLATDDAKEPFPFEKLIGLFREIGEKISIGDYEKRSPETHIIP